MDTVAAIQAGIERDAEQQKRHERKVVPGREPREDTVEPDRILQISPGKRFHPTEQHVDLATLRFKDDRRQILIDRRQRDVLQAVAEGNGPARMLVTLGYAGWGAGQLESEMAQNAWLSVGADDSIIFDVPPEERYPAALENLIALMPFVAHLQIHDNSIDAASGEAIPDPVLVAEMASGKLTWPDDLESLKRTPEWAKPLLEAAMLSSS